MYFRPILSPWRNTRSQALLAGVALFGTLAWLAGPIDDAGRKIWLPSCPLRMLIDLPCPFCGLTTGSAWMMRGEIRQAFRSNILTPALGIGVLVATVYILGCRMFLGIALDLEVGPTKSRTLWLLAAMLVALSWTANLYRTIT
jgi:Protein of unknown function (DUF2752)